MAKGVAVDILIGLTHEGVECSRFLVLGLLFKIVSETRDVFCRSQDICLLFWCLNLM